MKRVFSILLLICIIGIAFGCSNQKVKVAGSEKTKAEVPQKYSEVLGAIPEEELSYLGAHFCWKAGGRSWRCEQAKQSGESYKYYRISPEEEFSVLLVIHDERPVSEYTFNSIPIIGGEDGFMRFYEREVIAANPLPVEYKGKKLYVLEPDYSQVDKTPGTFSYYFALNTMGDDLLTPGFKFKE